MTEKLTRQGIRDLNDLRGQPKGSEPPKPYLGGSIACSHPNMRTCCVPCCGHYFCDDCGLTWDDSAGM